MRGVRAKLERADESIRNLDSEIVEFLKKPKGGFSNDQEKATHEFLEHARREVPARFGVLAGEVAHHLRSVLDHVVWELSSAQYRRTKESQIAFPILLTKPSKKEEIASYYRRIQGVESLDARDLIEKLQPYNTADPVDDPLAILHEFDRIDKHRTLVLVECKWQMGLTIPLRAFTWSIIPGTDIDEKLFSQTLADKVRSELSLYIAFPQFGRRPNQEVIPSLTQLANFTGDVIRQFSEL